MENACQPATCVSLGHSHEDRPDGVDCQEAGQIDDQAERQDQPQKGYEWDVLLPTSHICQIIPKALKHSLFLSGQSSTHHCEIVETGNESKRRKNRA